MKLQQKEKQILTAADFRPNPYPLYAELLTEDTFRRANAMLPTLKWSYVVTRYDDVSALLRDPRMSSDITTANSWLNLRTARWVPKAFRSFLNSMIVSDAPDHTRLRRLVSKGFTTRVIRRLEGRIVETTQMLLDDMEGKEVVDLMQDFALPLPLIVISEMMGVPEEDRATLHKYSIAFIDEVPNSLGSMARQTPTFWGLQNFF